MIAADHYIKNKTENLDALDLDQQEFQIHEAFTGGELKHETHRELLSRK